MPKGVERQDLANSGAAQGDSSTLMNNASGIFGGLAPTLESEAAHPSGYTPTQIAAQNTAAQQSAGGSQAATAGEGGLYAARTKNAGAAQSAIGAGTRAAGANLSNAATGVETSNANLAEKKQAGAQSALGGLYGQNVSGGLGALGESNQALSGAAQADENNPWLSLLKQGISSGGQVAAAGLGNGGAWNPNA
jgi:hypothetical protein